MRGVAVLAVLIFHASAVALPGGFAGVDVFFVISGFVVGRNVLGDLAGERFSFAAFYARRARRLFPGLILVLLATLIAAPFFVSMADYRELGRQIAAACVFAANFLAWSQAGYFDGDAAYR
ncbi:MAG: acyltransferase family protein, partial [Rhodoblastus sp.]|nr:acyltransferase family protein [Rhodoblastus sp.]